MKLQFVVKYLDGRMGGVFGSWTAARRCVRETRGRLVATEGSNAIHFHHRKADADNGAAAKAVIRASDEDGNVVPLELVSGRGVPRW